MEAASLHQLGWALFIFGVIFGTLGLVVAWVYENIIFEFKMHYYHLRLAAGIQAHPPEPGSTPIFIGIIGLALIAVGLVLATI